MSAGLDLADTAFAVVGVLALLAALLPRALEGRPVPVPAVFLAIGAGLGWAPFIPFDADPLQHGTAVEHLTEVTVVIALMGVGLSLDRRPGRRRWAATWRLLGIAMPLTIAALAVLGATWLSLAPAAALLLGAALAPTDPVLAGDVQVGEPAATPDEADEDEVRFALTSEAGLNDALAFPFVYLALLVAQRGTDPSEWVGRWLALDVLYRTAVGALVGVALGALLGRLFFSPRRKALRLSAHREGFVAVAATFLAYGLTELLHGYGFVAVFVAAVAIRGSERFHGYHQVLHEFVSQVERLLTVLVLVLVGAALADGLLAALEPVDVAFVAVLLLVVRPLAAGLALLGAPGTRAERGAIAFFGVRGIGSAYYLAYALTAVQLAEAQRLWAVVALTIAASVLVHGTAAEPVMRRLDARRAARHEAAA